MLNLPPTPIVRKLESPSERPRLHRRNSNSDRHDQAFTFAWTSTRSLHQRLVEFRIVGRARFDGQMDFVTPLTPRPKIVTHPLVTKQP